MIEPFWNLLTAVVKGPNYILAQQRKFEKTKKDKNILETLEHTEEFLEHLLYTQDELKAEDWARDLLKDVKKLIAEYNSD